MNKNILLATRLIITIIVAGLLSTALGMILVVVFASLGMSTEDSFNSSTALTYVIFGVAVGYRLNDLLQQRKK